MNEDSSARWRERTGRRRFLRNPYLSRDALVYAPPHRLYPGQSSRLPRAESCERSYSGTASLFRALPLIGSLSGWGAEERARYTGKRLRQRGGNCIRKPN